MYEQPDLPEAHSGRTTETTGHAQTSKKQPEMEPSRSRSGTRKLLASPLCRGTFPNPTLSRRPNASLTPAEFFGSLIFPSSMNSSAPAISVQGLKKSYGEVHAVKGIDFEIQPGEVFGLLGPNGAGKTTTVEILEGLRPPDGGTVTVCGLDPQASGDAYKQEIGA